MKLRVIFAAFLCLCAGLYGQQTGMTVPEDSLNTAIAERYLLWAEQAIEAGRLPEAKAALERAAINFADVSSDISYLLAVTRNNMGESRSSVLQAVEYAIRTGRWARYSETQARLLEAEMLVAMRRYPTAINSLIAFTPATETADSAFLRLDALKGLADNGRIAAFSEFRTRMIEALNRYPRDPRFLRLLFTSNGHKFGYDDAAMFELAFIRLPFLINTDPELAWLAASFMEDADEARKLVSAYRAGTSKPNPASLVPALNLGLLFDVDAVDELLGSADSDTDFNEEIIINKDIIINVGRLLRSGGGRDYLAHRLQSFSGIITASENNYGYIESRVIYRHGIIEAYYFDEDLDGIFDQYILFKSGNPEIAQIAAVPAAMPAQNGSNNARVFWEQYPMVKQTVLDREIFRPAPGDFQCAPVDFIELCASDNIPGLLFPRLNPVRQGITRRMLASNAVSVQRPSSEFSGGTEHIYLDRGIPIRAEEILDSRIISLTEFENGWPVIQRLDMDLDGRMETTRRFHRNESGEMYQEVDSVVYNLEISR
jgi:hypothetical protein